MQILVKIMLVSLLLLASVSGYAQKAALEADAFMTSFHYSDYDEDLRWVQMCGYTIGLHFEADGVRYDTLMCEDTWLQDSLMSYLTPIFLKDRWLYSGSIFPRFSPLTSYSYHLVDTSGIELARSVIPFSTTPFVLPQAFFSHLRKDTILAASRRLSIASNGFPEEVSFEAESAYPSDDGNYVIPISSFMHKGRIHSFGLWSINPYSNSRDPQPWIAYGTFTPFEDGDSVVDTFKIIRKYPSVFDSLRSPGLDPFRDPPRGHTYRSQPQPARRTLSAVPVKDICGNRFYSSDGTALYEFNPISGAMRLLDTLQNYSFGNFSLIIFTDNTPLQPNFFKEPSVCELWLDLDFDRSSHAAGTLGGAGSFYTEVCVGSPASLLDEDAVALTSRPADSLVIQITNAVSAVDALFYTGVADTTYHVTGSGTQRLVLHNDAFLTDSAFVEIAQTGIRLTAGNPIFPLEDTLVASWQLHISDSIAPVVFSYVKIFSEPIALGYSDSLLCEQATFLLPDFSATQDTISWYTQNEQPISEAVESGLYSYTITSDDGCSGRDTLNLIFDNPDTIKIVFTACNGEALRLLAHPDSVNVFADTSFIFSYSRQNKCDSFLFIDVQFSGSNLLSTDTLEFCTSFNDTIQWLGQSYYSPGSYYQVEGSSACPDTMRLEVVAAISPISEIVGVANCEQGAAQLQIPDGFQVESIAGQAYIQGDWVTMNEDSLVVYDRNSRCPYPIPIFRDVEQGDYTGRLSAQRINAGEPFEWIDLLTSGASLTWTPITPENLTSDNYVVQQDQIVGLDSLVLKGTWSDGQGCELVDQIVILLNSETDIIGLPNAFSPNSDGINDEWAGLFPLDVTVVATRIFNRWGEMVFFAEASGEGWDGNWQGKPAQSGVYVAMVEVITANGETKILTESVHLIR